MEERSMYDSVKSEHYEKRFNDATAKLLEIETRIFDVEQSLLPPPSSKGIELLSM